MLSCSSLLSKSIESEPRFTEELQFIGKRIEVGTLCELKNSSRLSLHLHLPRKYSREPSALLHSFKNRFRLERVSIHQKTMLYADRHRLSPLHGQEVLKAALAYQLLDWVNLLP